MSDKTGIEWTDATWNPTVGCSIVSPGCTNCYAMKMAARLEKMGQPIYTGMTQQTKRGAVWAGKVEPSNWGQVIKPLSWKKPRRIFVNSMSDLFHEALPDETIDTVFAVMAVTPRHTYQVLTKRPERMLAYLARPDRADRTKAAAREIGYALEHEGISLLPRVLPNVWLGVSAEDQARAEERIPILAQVPAAVRFVSAEPLLGPLNLAGFAWMGEIDWLIIGGESGHRARYYDLAWPRAIIEQCKALGIACFHKQIGAWPLAPGSASLGSIKTRYPTSNTKGGDMAEWPEDLRVRDFPPAVSGSPN